MKICSKCSHENKDESIFCTKCGSKLKKDIDLTKIVLLVGVFLVMFSSIFFGVLNWENMNNLFRLLFFVFETCLFFLMSLALKKVSNKISRIFFVIGLILTPFTLSMVPYYNIIPSIFYNEALIYLYLAIIYLLTFVAYLLINIKFKGKILNYLGLLSLLLSFVFASFIFNKNIVFTGLLITLYMLVVNILYKIFKENKIYHYFSLVLSFLVTPLLVYCFTKTGTLEVIINLVSLIIFMADAYLKMIFNKRSILYIFAPFMFQTLTFVYVAVAFGENDFGSILTLALINVALYFVTWIFKNKPFSIITLVLTYVMFGTLLFGCTLIDNNMLIVIISSISLVFNLILLIVKKYNFAHFLITISILTLVLGLNFWLYNFNSLIIAGFLSIIYLIIYLVLKLIKNKYDFAYLIIMLLIGLVSSILMLDSYGKFGIINLIICLTFMIGYVLINIFKEHISIRIIWYVIFNILILALFNNIYYSLLTISIFTIVSSIIFEKTIKTNCKPYVLYAEIMIFAITLFNQMDNNIYSLFINVLAFVLGYLCLVKYHNKTPWKIAYVMVGLLYIVKLLGVIVEPVVISSLIALLIILILITTMYLLDTFKSYQLVIISLIALIPYFNLVYELNSELVELYLIPLVVYAIILLFVIKFRSNTGRNVFILVPFFTLGTIFIISNTGVISTIIDAAFAVTYMIIGLVKRYNLLVFLSIGYLVLSILFQIFTVLNSMAAIISLLVIGFILIFVAVIYSTRKKD